MFKKKKNEVKGKNANPGEVTKEFPDVELGKRIGNLYYGALGELAKILGPKPDLALVRQAVMDLKEKTIRDLVGLGKAREGLDVPRRAMVDLSLMNMMSSMDKSPDFKVLQDSVAFYRPKDAVFADVIMSFNIITQYANYELLRKQTPKEAQRLGLA